MRDKSVLKTTGRRLVRGAGHAATDLIGWPSGQLSSESTYLAARFMHRRTAGLSSRVALAALRMAPRSVDRGPDVRTFLDKDWRRPFEGLRSDGIARIPDAFDPEAVRRIVEFARTAPARITMSDGSRIHGTHAQRPDGASASFIVERFLLGNPDVQSLIASPQVAEFARRYFGIGPLIHPPILYWSSVVGTAPNATVSAELARSFHWDYDGLRGLRVHVNLTAVDQDSAPMQYLAGSHHPGALRPHALRHGDRGIPEEQVWRQFPRDQLRILTGPAGSTFVSDSQGLHRGTDPVRADRLFLVLPIQASGFAGYQLLPRAVPPRDPVFSRGLAGRRPELRLFRAG